jgi:ribosome-associated protein
MMISDITDNSDEHDTGDDTEQSLAPSKSQIKRECHHLLDIGDEILKLNNDDINSLELPDDLAEAITTARKIKSRSGLKRQRQYIGKLLRSIDSSDIEAQLRKIQHRHDTNTVQFKRLEKWRDSLIDNDRDALNEVIDHFPGIDRQYINQLIRAAIQQKKNDKPPAAARKLFRYLRELEENLQEKSSE